MQGSWLAAAKKQPVQWSTPMRGPHRPRLIPALLLTCCAASGKPLPSLSLSFLICEMGPILDLPCWVPGKRESGPRWVDMLSEGGPEHAQGLVRGRLFICFNEKAKLFLTCYAGLRTTRCPGLWWRWASQKGLRRVMWEFIKRTSSAMKKVREADGSDRDSEERRHLWVARKALN